MNRFISLSLITLIIGSISCFGYAQDSDISLHILRPVIHAEREKAEICLEFDHVLDPGSHARLVTAIRLENQGKNQTLAPQNISLDGNNLCILNLEHGHHYRINVSGVRGTKGEKLSETYGLSFDIPDRHASLAFINTTSDNGLIRWGENEPVLRAVNISQIHVELYLITDLKAMGAAWQQRLQTTLAPSESVAFAQQQGQLIGQQDLDLKTNPNKDVEQALKLSALKTDIGPGLYLVVASVQPLDLKPNKNKKKKAVLAPMAAQWLLRSDLEIRALKGKDGYYILTERAHGTQIEPNLKVILQDASQNTLVQGQSDSTGVVFLKTADTSKNEAITVLGTTPRGEVAFADLRSDDSDPFTLPASDATLVTDKDFYTPQSPINVTLTAHDIHGQPLFIKDSLLQIQRADHSIYFSTSVIPNKKESTLITIAAPVLDEPWFLTWAQANGSVIAQQPLHITPNSKAPSFEVATDNAMIMDDGSVSLVIKSLSHEGQPAPFITGEVSVQWVVPDTLFQNLKNYTFGWRDQVPGPRLPVASFVTDEKGMTRLHVVLKPPLDHAPLRAALLTVTGDRASGIIGEAYLQLPVKPRDYIIGIKADARDNQFSENSLARFSVIAVDANGQYKNIDDLSYRVLEEGRHFDWYAADGRWDYKPLRQERRLGGAAFSITASEDNIIEWPVTAGDYRLDIMDADGTILAQLNFSAGWGKLTKDQPISQPLVLKGPQGDVHVGQSAAVHFHLPKPSLVTALVADNYIRDVVHVVKDEGDNVINIIPQSDWGTRLKVSVNAPSSDLGGHVILAMASGQGTDSMRKKTASELPSDTTNFDAEIPSSLRVRDVVSAFLNLNNNSSVAYHYTLVPSSGLTLAGLNKSNLSLLAGQHKIVPFTLRVTQNGDQYVRLEAVDARGNNITRRWPLAIKEDPISVVTKEIQKLDSQKVQTFLVSDHQQLAADQHFIFVMPYAFADLPQYITSFLLTKPFRTRDIAEWLNVSHAWQSVIINGGFRSAQSSAYDHQELILQLLSRQGSDGGFSAWPQQASDIVSTTAAIQALREETNVQIQPALDQAVNWLRRYLENGWFTEEERPLRAAAYAVLAINGSVDSSSLYYFADNSKGLPSLADAQLAQAFIAINDHAKAQGWLQASYQEPNLNTSLATLSVLASNPLTNPDDIHAALEKVAAKEFNSPMINIQSLMDYLRAVAALNDRFGSWHVNINGNDRKAEGMWVERHTDKPTVIRNLAKNPLYILPITENENKLNPSTIKRHIYTPNGTELTEGTAFERDRTYVIVLEGNVPKESKSTFIIHDEASPILLPTSCAFNHDVNVNSDMSWLKQLTLTPVIACEVTGHSFHAQLNPGVSNDPSAWRLIYFVKAEWSGHVHLTSPVLSPKQE